MKYISMRYGNTSLENEHLGPEKSCSFQIYQLKKNTCDSRKCRRPEKNSFKISTPLLKKYCHGSCQTVYNVLDKITLKVWRVRKLYLWGRIWVLRILGRMKSWIICGHLDNALWAKLLRKWEIGKFNKITSWPLIFWKTLLFQMNLEENVTFTFYFFSFASNFPCKILWDNKNIDANIFIFSNSIFTMKGVRSKKVILRFFLKHKKI